MTIFLEYTFQVLGCLPLTDIIYGIILKEHGKTPTTNDGIKGGIFKVKKCTPKKGPFLKERLVVFQPSIFAAGIPSGNLT